MMTSDRRREREPGRAWPKSGPAQEPVFRDPCSYIYPDGARCIYKGKLINGMCSAHNLITERNLKQKQLDARKKSERKDKVASPKPRKVKEGRLTRADISRRQEERRKARRAELREARRQAEEESRRQTAAEIGPPGDPSAPYCTCKNRTADLKPCAHCLKPHYMDWIQQGRKSNGKG